MKPVESIRECWNSEAAAYEAFNSAPDSYSRTIERPCIQGLLPELKGKAVLDLGCGTGIFTFLLEQFAPAELVGLDLSEGMLEIARKRRGSRTPWHSLFKATRAMLQSGLDGGLIWCFRRR